MKGELQPLVLIDGSSYFFRAFHALPPLMNSKGQPTGAIYGVINMVKRLRKDYPSELFAVVFDAKGKTFRDEMYPHYKANRLKMPGDLSSQFPPLIEVLKAMGLPLLIVEGVEADDVIGTLALIAREKGQPVLISTGDKDMAQLVSESVSLINTMSNSQLNLANFKEKFGIEPEQFIDYLTLMGDSVDNVPGVTNCGPKTAVKWLEQYQNLDALVNNADKIGGKIGERLRESLAHLPLSKRLLTIKTDVDLPFKLEELKPTEPNQELLIELIKQLEFKTWLKELLETSGIKETTTDTKLSFNLINDLQGLESLKQTLRKSPNLALSILTSSLDPLLAEILGLALAIEGENPWYIPLKSKEFAAKAFKTLTPIFEDAAILKIGTDLKFCQHLFKNHSVNLQGLAFDTMLESYILNSTATKHDIDSLALKYLGHKTQVLEKAKELSLEEEAYFAVERAQLGLKLHTALFSLLVPSLKKILTELEIPLISVLSSMERCGVLIDIDRLREHGLRLKKRLKELEDEAYLLAGKNFNLNSPKQLQEILFEEQGLPIISKTPKGQASTAESVLQELAYEFRLPAVILEFRSLAKLVSTYIDALPKRENPNSKRVHTSYNQAVTTTGRLSSTEPNLQNIPIRSEEGRLIRTTFIARPGFKILAADYSQIELRIMAHLSEDANLIAAFVNGWDIHTATAAEVLQLPLSEVSSEQRRRAKAINFGLIYGMSAFGLSKQLGISRDEAQSYIDKYFTRYPGVLEYMERTRKLAHQQGYVETLFGRRLYLPEIHAQNLQRRKAAERMAINAPMQGTAADIIKRAMLAIHKWQSTANLPFFMIMQVHDELVFEVPVEQANELAEQIKFLMESTSDLSVPLQVSLGIGANWQEAHS